jgi:hypothetical protein
MGELLSSFPLVEVLSEAQAACSRANVVASRAARVKIHVRETILQARRQRDQALKLRRHARSSIDPDPGHEASERDRGASTG